MDRFTKLTLLFLSAQLFVMGLLVSHLAYKLGLEQGKAAVYQSFAPSDDDGTCFYPGGCRDIKPKTSKRNK